jgi:hypothetical protein
LKGHSDQGWEVKFSTNEPGAPGKGKNGGWCEWIVGWHVID